MISELFCEKRCPTFEVSGVYTSLTLKTNGFAGPKSFRGFRETDPRFLTHVVSHRGDYRSGKRLNMRKVIPYIASQFRKDKIWLRRTKPSKRQYQIMLAVDDSSSMNDNHSKQVRERNE